MRIRARAGLLIGQHLRHACAHRGREGFKADRVACINRIRGLLAEFGPVFAKGPAAARGGADRHA